MNVDENAVEDEQCGCCVIQHDQVDGQRIEVHHQIPDDYAPHSATSECGCHPEVFHEDGIRVYLHLDQDHDEDLDWGPSLPD